MKHFSVGFVLRAAAAVFINFGAKEVGEEEEEAQAVVASQAQTCTAGQSMINNTIYVHWTTDVSKKTRKKRLKERHEPKKPGNFNKMLEWFPSESDYKNGSLLKRLALRWFRFLLGDYLRICLGSKSLSVFRLKALIWAELNQGRKNLK